MKRELEEEEGEERKEVRDEGGEEIWEKGRVEEG